MPEPLFLDTSAFIALEDVRDINHQAARFFFQPHSIKGRFSLMTTNYVFSEVYTWFCRNHEVAIRVGQAILDNPLIQYVRVSAKDEKAAWELTGRYKDKDFSFTDLTSFVVMWRLGCRHAFTFDRHFVQMGFVVLPELSRVHEGPAEYETSR